MIRMDWYGTQYRVHDQPLIDAMEAVVDDERQLVPVRDVLEVRLELDNRSEEHGSPKDTLMMQSTWWENSIETNQALLVLPEGKAKIVTGPEILYDLTDCSDLTEGGRLAIINEVYEEAEGLQIQGLEKDIGRVLGFDSEEGRRIWDYVTGNWKCLDKYRALVEHSYRFNSHDRTMEVFLPAPEEEAYLINFRISKRASALSATGRFDETPDDTKVIDRGDPNEIRMGDLLELKIEHAIKEGTPLLFKGRHYRLVPEEDE